MFDKQEGVVHHLQGALWKQLGERDESQQGQTGTDFRVHEVTVDEMWVAVGGSREWTDEVEGRKGSWW